MTCQKALEYEKSHLSNHICLLIIWLNSEIIIKKGVSVNNTKITLKNMNAAPVERCSHSSFPYWCKTFQCS